MDTEEQIFKIFHRYNKLVRRQLVKPLTHDCGQNYMTRIGDSDMLYLWCPACNVEVAPGMETINTVRSVVKEHFE